MPIINSTLFNNQITDLTRNAQSQLRPTDIDGKIRVVVDNVYVNSLSSPWNIVLFKLPKGSKLISLEIFTSVSGPTDALLGIGTIGYDGTVTVTEPTKYGTTEIDLSGAGRIQMVKTPFLVPDFVLSTETAIILNGSLDNISAWAFSFVAMYVVNN